MPTPAISGTIVLTSLVVLINAVVYEYGMFAVLDLMMPVMDGWDFRHAQLQDPRLRDIPVVIVTAAGFSIDTIRTQFGDVALVPKPAPLFDLLTALDRASGAASAA